MIDEYQDLGKPLHEMILAFFRFTKMQIFAVGDPDQSIYGFSGAFPEFLNELSAYPTIETIELETNYRSTQDIIDASKMALNDETRERNYKAGKRIDENALFFFYTCNNGMDDQYKLTSNIINDIKTKYSTPLEEICVLLKRNKEVQLLGKILGSSNIPHYIPKHLFERSDIVKWLDNQVTITTRHSSKGLEFEVIIMLGMEEGSFSDFRNVDNKAKLNEEHRVFFVCVSRAKRICCLVRSKILIIPRRDGSIWNKNCEKSRFWCLLEEKYGDKNNIIDV